MKVLFLDIDGVVNCATTSQRHRGFIGIDPVMAFRVGKIVLDTGCEVVLSSSWRLSPDARDEVAKQVYKFIDVTPDLQGKTDRGCEITAWLEKHPEVTRHAILDDNTDFHADQPLFKTSWATGITDEIAKEVTDYLNEVCAGCGHELHGADYCGVIVDVPPQPSQIGDVICVCPAGIPV